MLQGERQFVTANHESFDVALIHRDTRQGYFSFAIQEDPSSASRMVASVMLMSLGLVRAKWNRY